MSEEKKKVKIVINHQTYTVLTNESEAYIEEIASELDEKMSKIKEMNHSLDSNRVAVLTALNIINDYTKLKKEYNVLLQLIEEDN